MAEKQLSGLQLTLFAQQEGVETEVIDSEVQPSLPGYTAFPIAAGIVIDQLLHLGHPKLLPHFQFSLFEFTWILFTLGLLILVLFSNNSLKGHGRREGRNERRNRREHAC